MKPKQLIIIGGGTSIREGIDKDLWKRLEGKFTLGLNYSYRFFEATAQVFVDELFYTQELARLKKLPLVIGNAHPNLLKKPESNVILLKISNSKYYRNILEGGCFRASLCGVFALSLGIHLLDEGEIFLLGYDFGNLDNAKRKDGRADTHFYTNVNHGGVGKIQYYKCKGRTNMDFDAYKGEEKVKIYNVSLKSKIQHFEKINYDEFFTKLDKETYDQDVLRQVIRKELTKE